MTRRVMTRFASITGVALLAALAGGSRAAAAQAATPKAPRSGAQIFSKTCAA